MELTECTASVNNITLLDDAPAISAGELKAKFDASGADIKTYLNDTLLPELEAGIPNVVNNLTTGGTTAALSAEQGKELQDNKQKTIITGTGEPSGVSGDIYLRYS